MKTLKTAGLIVAGIIGLAILAGVAITQLVNANRYRGVIESRVQTAAGRPFVIAGAIKLSFFPWLALDVRSVTLGNPPGFGRDPLFTAERVRLGARLLPLLSGQLEVSRIAVDGLIVTLFKRRDGHTNWEGLADHEHARGGTESRGLLDASIAGLDVSRAALTLRDEVDKSLARILDFELHTGTLGAARPADIALSARIDSGDGTPATRIELHTRAAVDPERSLATLTDFKLSGERAPVAPAKQMPFSVTTAQVSIDWKTGTLAPTALQLRLGDLPLSATVSGEQLFGTRLVKGRVQMTELSLRKLAASVGWSPPPTRDANAFSRVAVASNFHLSGGAITLEEIEATLDRSRLRGRAAIDSSATPKLSLDLHVDAINLDDYRAPTAPTAPVAKAAAAAPAPLPFAALRALDAHGSVAIDRASVSGLPLSDVHMTLTAYGGNIRILTSAKAFGGTATGDAHLDASHEPASLALTEIIRSVDVGAAVKAYAKSDRLSGAANAEAKLAGSGMTDAELIATLAGPIDVEIKNGALEGLDVPFEIEQAQALWRGQAPPSRSGPARTPFNVLSARSRFGRGVLMTDALQLETQVLKLGGKGTFRLSDQAVAYELIARVQETRAASGDAGVQRQRSLEIPITVTGTVHGYKVRPDVSNIVKDRVEQEIEKHKGELRDKLTDKLKDLFPH